VFAARGVEGATIQEIADSADVAKGSFYNHFDSREAVHLAVVEETLEQLGAALDGSVAATADDPADVIAASLLATVRTCVGDPVLGAFVLRSAGLLDVARAALGERGRRDLRAGMAGGRFRLDDVEPAATLVAGAAEALVRSRLNGELPPRAEIDFVALVLRMLGLSGDEAAEIAARAGRAPAAEPA
jgi:AcrR family transcriptional regulator